MLDQSANAGSEFESGKGKLVSDDRDQPGKRDRQRVMVEQSNAKQYQAEQNEVDRDSIKGQTDLGGLSGIDAVATKRERELVRRDA
jgi:hypothetical protein